MAPSPRSCGYFIRAQAACPQPPLPGPVGGPTFLHFTPTSPGKQGPHESGQGTRPAGVPQKQAPRLLTTAKSPTLFSMGPGLGP